jgi:hypothetical protein
LRDPERHFNGREIAAALVAAADRGFRRSSSIGIVLRPTWTGPRVVDVRVDVR